MTDEQKQNLRQLATYLRGDLKAKFSMRTFAQAGYSMDSHDCGRGSKE